MITLLLVLQVCVKALNKQYA